MPTNDRAAAVIIGAVVMTLVLMGGLPGSAAGQEPRGVSAWTAEACRIEIERRGWRIVANPADDTPNTDDWLWFRLATGVQQSNDALCGEASGGGVAVHVLSAADASDSLVVDAGRSLLGACEEQLIERGWTRAGGASAVRTGSTILIQHVIRNRSGAEGVGHCAYQRDPENVVHQEGGEEPGAASLVSVSAEIVRPLLGIDAACRETFQALGWTASTISGPRVEARLLYYSVTGRKGRSQRVLCRYDAVDQTVQIEVEK